MPSNCPIMTSLSSISQGLFKYFPEVPSLAIWHHTTSQNISDSVAKTLNFLHRLLTITDVMLGKYVRHEVSLQKLFVEELVSSDWEFPGSAVSSALSRNSTCATRGLYSVCHSCHFCHCTVAPEEAAARRDLYPHTLNTLNTLKYFPTQRKRTLPHLAAISSPWLFQQKNNQNQILIYFAFSKHNLWETGDSKPAMKGLPWPGYLEDVEKHDRLAALRVGTGQWATGNCHCNALLRQRAGRWENSFFIRQK